MEIELAGVSDIEVLYIFVRGELQEGYWIEAERMNCVAIYRENMWCQESGWQQSSDLKFYRYENCLWHDPFPNECTISSEKAKDKLKDTVSFPHNSMQFLGIHIRSKDYNRTCRLPFPFP